MSCLSADHCRPPAASHCTELIFAFVVIGIYKSVHKAKGRKNKDWSIVFGTRFKGFHDTAKAGLWVSFLKQNTQTDKWRCGVRPLSFQHRQSSADPNNMHGKWKGAAACCWSTTEFVSFWSTNHETVLARIHTSAAVVIWQISAGTEVVLIGTNMKIAVQCGLLQCDVIENTAE